jgi:hypothetical protein
MYYFSLAITRDAAEVMTVYALVLYRIPLHEINRQIRTGEQDQDGQEMLLASGQSVGRHGHDHIGAAYLSSLGFPSTTCELVHDHVVAKRYLTAVEEGYYDALSEASKASLKFQVIFIFLLYRSFPILNRISVWIKGRPFFSGRNHLVSTGSPVLSESSYEKVR